MEYVLLYKETEAEFAERTNPETAPAYWGAWSAYMEAMTKAGVLKSGNALQPGHTATTVRAPGGALEVEDGPFADVKEQLGGYVVIEVADLDAALHWAGKAPCAERGSVEVRPVLSNAAAKAEAAA